jgi:hypothetical protein
MLDAKGFTKTLKKMTLTMKGLHNDLQALSVFAIHQIYQKNTNQAKELLMALTKPSSIAGERQYVSSDAQRVMQFISDFAPVVIQPVKGSIKLSQQRLDHGMVEREEDGYPNWYDWTKAHTPAQIKEVDGLAILMSSVKSVMDKVKNGKVVITTESMPVYEKLIKAMDNLLTAEANAEHKALAATKEIEQNQ